MQQMFDDIDDTQEDIEYLARREKRRQSRLEAQRRREKKLRTIKLCLGLAVISIVMICVVGPGLKKIENNPQKEEMGIVLEQNTEDIKSEEGETEKTESEESRTEDADTEVSVAVKPTKAIKFEESSDIKGIYSEAVISNYAILIDADSDKIIAKKNAYDRMIPASMTKVLTILVATDVITEANLNDTFTMMREITDYAYQNDCSSVGFLDGEVVTVRDLLYGTILASGGDAAVGLATYVAGSHEAFVELMNEKVKQLGLADSAHFTNCVGIYDKELYCTAYDMAVIMRAAMENELCREVLNARTYTTSLTTEHPEGITISNWFMRRIEDKDSGGEVLGAKTGYVVQSGNCAVSYQKDANGKTYICVTADSSSSWRCIYDHVEIYNTYVPELTN